MKTSLATRAVAAVLVLALLADQRAHGLPYRRKRTSDQRMAELEAYLGMSKLKGQMITVPIGFGRVNLDQIGRRRRSAIPHGLRELMDSSRPHDASDETLGDLLQDVEKSRPYQWDAY
ncbi:uncharacterized protein LOC134537520 [Bacillus rossius redtenbacheri]|uniref:uncharacterized protein LOC134537520 n=1 Tax=Bacillus rossius redtenbacheri TaxID=93214 RepID=UPI002FDEEC4C